MLNLKTEIMNPDDYILGTFDPTNPINKEDNEPLTKLEEQQNWNQDLLRSNKRFVADLKKLKEIEECFKTFGHLTFEEESEKNNILNKY